MEQGVQISGVKARHRDNGKVTTSLIILDKSTLLRFPLTLYLSLSEGQHSEVILTDSFRLVSKYILKTKVISKYFTLKQLFPWKMGAKGQISLMQLLNGDGPIVHWSVSCPLKRSLIGESVQIRTVDSLK